jgi:predicted nucleotidyltransferase
MKRKLLEKAVSALKASGAREVYIFGSAANGNEHKGSDIDIAVSGIPPEKFIRAMGDTADILKKPLDLVDLDEETPFTRYLREERELKRVG